MAGIKIPSAKEFAATTRRGAALLNQDLRRSIKATSRAQRKVSREAKIFQKPRKGKDSRKIKKIRSFLR